LEALHDFKHAKDMIRKVLSETLVSVGVKPHHRLLIACSGGVDSMVLATLVKELRYDGGLAHVNYHLRTPASDIDEQRVAEMALEYGMQFHRISAPKFEKGNFQEKARDFRYKWLEEIGEAYDYILTAHHLDDQRESFLQKIIRGAGLGGLQGIRQKNGKLLRPLLTVNRSDIFKFAIDQRIDWREDSSNQSLKYERNYLRMLVLPHLQSHHQRGISGFDRSMEIIHRAAERMDDLLDDYRERCLLKFSGGWEIDVDGLPKKHREDWLFDILRPYGNFDVKSVLENLESGTHAKCIRGEYILETSLARLFLLQGELNHNSPKYFGDNGVCVLNEDQRVVRGKVEDAYDEFPFVEGMYFRLPEHGDRLEMPNGTHKKLSDFFLEKRIPAPLRSRILWLGCKDEIILWIPGLYQHPEVEGEEVLCFLG
jgi:tRNA(Ile)-lysidine synthase